MCPAYCIMFLSQNQELEPHVSGFPGGQGNPPTSQDPV